MKQLTTVKISNKKVVIEWYETVDYQPDHIDDIYTFETEKKPHSDLLTELNRLRQHVKNICGFSKIPSGMEVRGVIFKGMDSDEGAKAMFIVQVKLDGGKVWGFNTPYASLFSTDDYNLAVELDKATAKVCKEAKLMLEEGKCAPNPQMEMDLKTE